MWNDIEEIGINFVVKNYYHIRMRFLNYLVINFISMRKKTEKDEESYYNLDEINAEKYVMKFI